MIIKLKQIFLLFYKILFLFVIKKLFNDYGLFKLFAINLHIFFTFIEHLKRFEIELYQNI